MRPADSSTLRDTAKEEDAKIRRVMMGGKLAIEDSVIDEYSLLDACLPCKHAFRHRWDCSWLPPAVGSLQGICADQVLPLGQRRTRTCCIKASVCISK